MPEMMSVRLLLLSLMSTSVWATSSRDCQWRAEQAATFLGYDETIWDNIDSNGNLFQGSVTQPAVDTEDWYYLDEEQKHAAMILGYTEDNWEDSDGPAMTTRWSDMYTLVEGPCRRVGRGTPACQGRAEWAAGVLGYGETAWDNYDSNGNPFQGSVPQPPSFTAEWYSLTDEEKYAARVLGYEEPCWDSSTCDGETTLWADLHTLVMGVCVQGDPHFKSAHGDVFDFRGRDGVLYAILSHARLEVNALFEAKDYHDSGVKQRLVHGSFMTAGYVRLANPDGREVTVEYDAKRAVFLQVGVDGATPTRYRAPFSLTLGNVSVSLSERVAKVVTPEFSVEMLSKYKSGIIGTGSTCADGKCFLEVTATPLINADTAIVAPHGLLGQAWDGDSVGVVGKTDEYKGDEITTSAMGEGAIEGVAADYEVVSKFSADFKFSRWGLTAAKPRNATALAGMKVSRTDARSSVE
jgi:hypothetical protein